MGVYVLYVMRTTTESGELEASIVDHHTGSRSFRNELLVHISVSEDGDWIGDFWVEFTKERLGGSDKYVADWDSVRSGGNGIYVDDQPPFWPVQEVVDKLNERYSLQEFVALNTAKGDI